MKIYQSNIFARRVKKLSKAEKATLDKEIKKMIAAPATGAEKRGDLRGVFVHKFKAGQEQYLLSYRFTEEILELIMLGPHENYYRDLKNYIKKYE